MSRNGDKYYSDTEAMDRAVKREEESDGASLDRTERVPATGSKPFSFSASPKDQAGHSSGSASRASSPIPRSKTPPTAEGERERYCLIINVRVGTETGERSPPPDYAWSSKLVRDILAPRILPYALLELSFVLSGDDEVVVFSGSRTYNEGFRLEDALQAAQAIEGSQDWAGRPAWISCTTSTVKLGRRALALSRVEKRREERSAAQKAAEKERLLTLLRESSSKALKNKGRGRSMTAGSDRHAAKIGRLAEMVQKMDRGANAQPTHKIGRARPRGVATPRPQ